MEYLIRPLTINDYDDLINLWRRSGLTHRPAGRDSRESMSVEFKRSESCFLGMYDREKLIGSIIGTYDGRRGWMNRLAIDPDYRGLGLAGKMVREAEEFLSRLGARVIAGLIEEENTPSISAFRKAGYQLHPNILYFSRRTSPQD
jgi:ribosomal protein S18 acetylase RimI-like enzyme